MTGKELANQLFEAFAQGTPGDDPALAERMGPQIAALSTDEMWRFVYVAGTRGMEKNVFSAFSAFNVAIAKHDGYKAAIAAMHAAPKPEEWPPSME